MKKHDIMALLIILLLGLVVAIPGVGMHFAASTIVSDNAKNQPFLRFAIISDTQGLDNGVNSQIIMKAMEQIKKLNPQPELFVIPGDLVNGAKSYKDIKVQLTYLRDILSRYYPSDYIYRGIGNHELVAGIDGIKASRDVFKEKNVTYLKGTNNAVYYFDRGNARFWMLDTDHKNMVGKVSDVVINWIRQNTRASAKHNFFFVHEPPFPTGVTSLLVDTYQRDRLWQVIESTNSPIVYNGHEHYYTRRHINSDYNETINGKVFKFKKNIYQVTVAGMPDHLNTDYSSTKDVDIPPISVNHYAIVDVFKNKVITTVYNINKKIIDKFTVKN